MVTIPVMVINCKRLEKGLHGIIRLRWGNNIKKKLMERGREC